MRFHIPAVVKSRVIERVRNGVHDEFQQRRHNGFAALWKQEILKMIIGKGRIFYINFADDADFYLLLAR